MNKTLISIILLLVAVGLSAQEADEDEVYRTALSFKVGVEGTDISVRRLLKPNLAMLMSFGYSSGQISSVGSQAPAGSQDTDVLELGLGLRRYLRGGEFRPLVEFEARYQYIDTSQCSNRLDDFSVLAAGGVEYFFSKRFSVEGTVGATYGRQEYGCYSGGGEFVTVERDGFNTIRSSVGVNFHF